MNFTSLNNYGAVEGYCIVKSADCKTSSKGDRYLDLTLSDKSGEINAKIWSYSEADYGTYAVGDIIKVRGTISVYNNSDQLKIERIRKADESDNVNPADLVASAEYDADEMFSKLLSTAQSFENAEISKLVSTMLNENRQKLLYWPAAFKLHHAIRGGLLMHTLSIVKMAESACNVYPFVNRDILLAGAILHDIAKIDEYTVPETGIATGYSVQGNLLGHLAEGAMMIRETARRIGTPDDIAILLEHMLLSHHGSPEFGAAVRPMFIEAELLSELDMLDARLYEMREATKECTTGEFSGKLWALDNRKLYNHGLSDLNKNPNLL